jgi:hypothetical protein
MTAMFVKAFSARGGKERMLIMRTTRSARFVATKADLLCVAL